MTDEQKQRLKDYQKEYFAKKSSIKVILLLIKHIINYNNGNSFNE